MTDRGPAGSAGERLPAADQRQLEDAPQPFRGHPDGPEAGSSSRGRGGGRRSVHPPFTDIRSVQTLIDADDIPISLGAQHCHWEEKGAFTRRRTVFLAKLNVRYVITGPASAGSCSARRTMVAARPPPSSRSA